MRQLQYIKAFGGERCRKWKNLAKCQIVITDQLSLSLDCVETEVVVVQTRMPMYANECERQEKSWEIYYIASVHSVCNLTHIGRSPADARFWIVLFCFVWAIWLHSSDTNTPGTSHLFTCSPIISSDLTTLRVQKWQLWQMYVELFSNRIIRSNPQINKVVVSAIIVQTDYLWQKWIKLYNTDAL